MPDNQHYINCDSEPIHIPGRIQGQGFLIAFNKDSELVAYVSQNIQDYCGIDPREVLSQKFSKILTRIVGEHESDVAISFLHKINLHNRLPKNSKSVTALSGKMFTLVFSEHENMVLAEFELLDSEQEDRQHDFSDAYSTLVSFHTISERAKYLCDSIRAFSNYDRIMVYKFDEDYNGEVIAESNAPGIHSFLHHRFPAADIPKQARELYVKNLMRIIADVNDEGSALLTLPDYAHQPLDLTYSILRAVSPVHIEYLKNMGVQASFSTSIVVQGKLWGLVACHNFEPSLISYDNRFRCRTISQILASSIPVLTESAAIKEKEKYSKAYGDVMKSLAISGDPKQILQFRLNESTGCAYVSENTIELVGKTPGREEVRKIAEYIFQHRSGDLFYTTNLKDRVSLSENGVNTASGALAVVLDEVKKEMLLWFKPDMPQKIEWAGNPQKIIDAYQSKKTLNPRTSFASWSETVAGKSEEWSLGEIGIAKSLQDEYHQLSQIRAAELLELNEKLKRAYDELYTFSYTVSHDLKTPLTGIKNYAELVKLTQKSLAEDATTYLDTIIRNANRMNNLINDIFLYSKAGYTDVGNEEVKIESVVDRIVAEYKTVYGDKVNVVCSELINIKGNELMLYQMFSNILGNAIKYSSHQENPMVTVSAEKYGDGIVYKIQDNGIGMPEEEVAKVFTHFLRMSNSRDYEGTGLGMAIAKRIADKHNAEIRYQSSLGKGTVCEIIFR